MMINSKAKGKLGELEVVHLLKKLGFKARRGVQYRGTPDSPDVVIDGIVNIHIEVKKNRTMRIGGTLWKKALKQCKREAGSEQIPLLFWHEFGRGWRLTTQVVIKNTSDKIVTSHKDWITVSSLEMIEAILMRIIDLEKITYLYLS